jgi:hypothetical protein
MGGCYDSFYHPSDIAVVNTAMNLRVPQIAGNLLND